MNIIQLVRKARLGCDAILPGGLVSSQWSTEEVVNLAGDTAYGEVLRRYRLVRKKWGMRTVKATDAAFTQEGELYTPEDELKISANQQSVMLPPDFAEIVRILCLNDRTVRFVPAEMESFHWIDQEQSGRDNADNILTSGVGGLIMYYDIVDNRTLIFSLPLSSTLTLQVDYIPLKRPLYFSVNGTVEQSSTTLTGTSTTWLDDSIFTEDSGNAAQLITGTNDPTHSSISLVKDYPRVASIASNTAATMVLGATVTSGTTAIMAMAPILPRDTHGWIAEYTSSLMLRKINPELADKHANDVLRRFEESIRPTAGRRQGQESPITEDSEEFGVYGDWR